VKTKLILEAFEKVWKEHKTFYRMMVKVIYLKSEARYWFEEGLKYAEAKKGEQKP
jgi:hypothetical protein